MCRRVIVVKAFPSFEWPAGGLAEALGVSGDELVEAIESGGIVHRELAARMVRSSSRSRYCGSVAA